MGHARALIGHAAASELAQKAVNDNLTVRDVESLARSNANGESGKKGAKSPAQTESLNADISAVQRHLEEFLGMNVRIKADKDPSTGAVTIKYRSLDQLDLLCQRLTGGDI